MREGGGLILSKPTPANMCQSWTVSVTMRSGQSGLLIVILCALVQEASASSYSCNSTIGSNDNLCHLNFHCDSSGDAIHTLKLFHPYATSGFEAMLTQCYGLISEDPCKIETYPFCCLDRRTRQDFCHNVRSYTGSSGCDRPADRPTGCDPSAHELIKLPTPQAKPEDIPKTQVDDCPEIVDGKQPADFLSDHRYCCYNPHTYILYHSICRNGGVSHNLRDFHEEGGSFFESFDKVVTIDEEDKIDIASTTEFEIEVTCCGNHDHTTCKGGKDCLDQTHEVCGESGNLCNSE